MSEKTEARGFLLVIPAVLVLTVALAFVGIRIEGQIKTLKTEVEKGQAPGASLPRLESVLKRVAEGRTVYVPAYAHFGNSAHQEQVFETTLTIRNTDPEQAIVINSVQYYGSNGEMAHQYQGKPVVLDPMAVAEYPIERPEAAAGIGASFVVEWVAEKEVNEPVIEALMVSASASWAISFVRLGHPIENVP